LEQNGGIAVTRYGAASGVSWINLGSMTLDNMEAPNPTEGIDQWTLNFVPRLVNATIQDPVLKYLGW